MSPICRTFEHSISTNILSRTLRSNDDIGLNHESIEAFQAGVVHFSLRHSDLNSPYFSPKTQKNTLTVEFSGM